MKNVILTQPDEGSKEWCLGLNCSCHLLDLGAGWDGQGRPNKEGDNYQELHIW